MQTSSIISEVINANNQSIIPTLLSYINKGCFLGTVNHIDHLTHLLAYEDELLLIKTDCGNVGDWLADEETFGQDEPLYFSESSHIVSPLFYLSEALRFVSHANNTRKINQKSYVHRIHALYLTSRYIINEEDMTEQWKEMNISVYHNLRDLDEQKKYFINNEKGHDVAEAILREIRSACLIKMKQYLYSNETTPTLRDKDSESETFGWSHIDNDNEEETDDFDMEPDFDVEDFIPQETDEENEPFPFLPFEEEQKENSEKDWHEVNDSSDSQAKEESIIDEINSMTGLAEVKAKIKDFKNLTLFNKKLEALGCPTHKISTHAIFKGNPGTGKTTVAKKWGTLLKQLGYLSKGHVVYCDRSMLIGKHYGDEEKYTREALKKAAGGVLFIDEAYTLASKDTRDPGIHVLETLMNVLADEKKRDICIILAGYEGPMNELIASNPGIKSRFPKQNIFHFADFSPEELMQIAVNRLEEKKYTLSTPALQKLQYILEDVYKQKDTSYGNARFVCNCLESIYLKHATRCIEENDEDLFTIKETDIPEMEEEKEKRKKIGF